MPESRPSIPAELRRRVLLESGHRCAIHTCRHPDVDVHHIVPWAKVREHHFDNLIALCPNCHRRADAGDIDRKSLVMYKARLAAVFDVADTPRYPEELATAPSFSWVDPAARWRTLVERLEDPSRKLSVELEYPELSTAIPGAGPLNTYIWEMVTGVRDEFIRNVSSPEFQEYPSTLGCQLNTSFAVSLLTDQLASLRFTMYAFAGGAHGNHWTEVVNYNLSPPRPLALADIFDDLSLGLQALSSHCIAELTVATPERYARDPDRVRASAGPDLENFRRFNLTPSGILITFDTYAIASYAEGPSEVVVPYSSLRPALKPSLGLGQTRGVPDA